MSLLSDIGDKVEEYTAHAKMVSNGTSPANPESWRGDNEPGRYATFLEEISIEIESKYRQIEELDCQGEWCGKSPTRHDNGLCGVCKLQKELFVDKLG